MSLLAGLLAQAAPSSGDALIGVLSGLGSGGATATVLWVIYDRREKRHAVEMDAKDARIKELTEKLFDLAQTGSQVAQRATEVVETPNLAGQLARIQAHLDVLLHERGSR